MVRPRALPLSCRMQTVDASSSQLVPVCFTFLKLELLANSSQGRGRGQRAPGVTNGNERSFPNHGRPSTVQPAVGQRNATLDVSSADFFILS